MIKMISKRHFNAEDAERAEKNRKFVLLHAQLRSHSGGQEREKKKPVGQAFLPVSAPRDERFSIFN